MPAVPLASLQSQAAKPVSSFPKQAIVVIHGMGEQMPMDTIRNFVRAVWETDAEITATGSTNPSEVWSKPDVRTGSLELRRITTRESISTDNFANGIRSDFYELYWADLSGGSTWSHVRDWIAGLLFRNPFTRVPRNVLLAWFMLWVLGAVVVTFAIATALPKDASLLRMQLWSYPPLAWLQDWQAWHLAVVAAVFAMVAHYIVVPYFGRVVRYTRAKPENIDARTKIRQRGLDLLKALHDAGEYERIVIVGHSLGSIVAYELISYFWAARPDSHSVEQGTPEFQALRALEAAGALLLRDPNLANRDAYRVAQRALCRLLRMRDKPAAAGQPDTRWLITDLVTVGSPLTHAEFLLANDRRDLGDRMRGREFPTCPPVRELLEGESLVRARTSDMPLDTQDPRLFCFPFGQNGWQLHHGAPYAVVRWTNIHDPAVLVFLGDMISGPIAPIFGPGIRDINLRETRGQALRFTHLDYWALDENRTAPQTAQIREAIDVAGRYTIL
jgi:hypothetical protein